MDSADKTFAVWVMQFLKILMPGPCSGKNLISILVTAIVNPPEKKLAKRSAVCFYSRFLLRPFN